MKPVREIIDTLREANKLLLVSHISPDFDTLASMLALKHALEKSGKEVSCYNADEIPPKMTFLPGVKSIVNKLHPRKTFDVTIFLDSSSPDRFGELFERKIESRFGTAIKVDHHQNGKASFDLEYVDSKSASTGEMVCELIKRYPVEFDYNIAFCIYVAIVSDTGGFRYANTNANAFNTAAQMLDYGVEPWEVTTKLYENRPLAEICLLAKVLQDMEIHNRGRFALLSVTQEQIKTCKAKEYMLDGFVNYGRSVKGVEVAILISELKSGGSFKISFRSKGKLNVADIAEKFDGGGHKNAAGCTIKGSLLKVKEKLLKAIKSELK